MKKEKKVYETPKVITYSEDEILELIGPAQTCSPYNPSGPASN
jgi:hypothetical protein